jgi:hypothetical protein
MKVRTFFKQSILLIDMTFISMLFIYFPIMVCTFILEWIIQFPKIYNNLLILMGLIIFLTLIGFNNANDEVHVFTYITITYHFISFEKK